VIRSIAFVPQPPLLVPELMGAAAGEAEALRCACRKAVAALGPGPWYAVGVDPSGPMTVRGGAGSFAGYGVDVRVSLDSSSTPGALPLPMLVSGWLRGQAGAESVMGEVLHPDTGPEWCRERGRELASEVTSLLVLGDGSTMHDVPGAGRVDERAVAFDATVARALADAEPAALAALDPGVAAELGATGRAPWQLAAAAAAAAAREWGCAPEQTSPLTGELLYSAAPYGVGYHVAVWERR
jgi:hypothetical protein